MKKDRQTDERRRKEKQRNIRLTEDERLQHFIYELQVVPSILNVKGNVSRDFRFSTLGVKVQLILAALYQRNCEKTSEMPTFSCNWIFHKLVNISITLDHAHITVSAQSTPWSQNVRA